MRTLAIVQARATSSRLRNKVLLPLAGSSVLGHVLTRCIATPGIDHVCCAVPEDCAHDQVADEAARYGALIFRGSENDVLGRFAAAAQVFDADVVVRVTSDCPLADPEICGKVIAMHMDVGADYTCNNMPASWPHGLDCEVFSADLLLKANAIASEPFEREHVTPWMRTAPNIIRANLKGPGGELLRQRWTLDYPEDYRFLERLFSLLPSHPTIPCMNTVLDVLRRHPYISFENRMHLGISRPATQV